jgi:NifB/MoaA-like Fe-S oxidoreductase
MDALAAEEEASASDKAGWAATPREISLATGKLAAPYLEQLYQQIRRHHPEVTLHIHTITNHFFGEKITVAGLITGTDLKEQLQGLDLGSELLLPVSMLRSGEQVFLDDITVEELEKTLQTRIRIVKSSGYDFVRAVTGQAELRND